MPLDFAGILAGNIPLSNEVPCGQHLLPRPIIGKSTGGYPVRKEARDVTRGNQCSLCYCAAAAEVATPSSFSLARARRSSSVPG
jgi:hypothetical protein